MSVEAQPAPQTPEAPPSAERDAAIALLQSNAEALEKAGAPKVEKPAAKGKGKAAEKAPAEPVTPAEPAAEGEAPAEPEEAKEGEAPAEEEKPAEPPKSPPWKAYERKKAALKEERSKLEQAKADLNAQAQQLARAAQIAREVEQLRAQAAENPLAVLEAFGIDYSTLTSHVLKAGTPEAKLEQLERQLKAQQEQAQHSARVAQAEAEFLLEARRPDFAALRAFEAEHGPRVVIQEAYEVGQQLRRELGRDVSDRELAAELDRRASLYQNSKRGTAPTVTPARTPGPGEQAKSSVTRAPKTISQQHASETTGKSREETESERVERARELLAQGLRGKRLARRGP